MAHHLHPGSDHSDRVRGFLVRWFLYNLVISGILSLLWLVLRSGPKPTRFAYPCQRAAAATAMSAFAAPLLGLYAAARRQLMPRLRTPAVVLTLLVGVVLTASVSIYLSRAMEYEGPVLDPPRDYRAEIFHVTGCPQDPGGDHLVGLSNLLVVMGRSGLKFYDSPVASPVAGPEGIFALDDIVVIKINYQWDQRGGTNVDLLRGLIRTVVDHPDGFTGEVVVCENAQFNPVQGFDYAQNNAQDHGLSPHDVVVGFQQLGYNVSHFDWTSIRGRQVQEFSQGDLTDGYIVGAYDASYHWKLSYPKFRSESGTCISLKYGIWDPELQAYDRESLKFLNVPVLKSHHATYGATVSTKHYMGVVTDQFSTNSHTGIRYGIMGALMNEIRMADLNIVDAVWINANPNGGPWTSYSAATRRDELVASLDPIALDRWAVKNILIPGFVSNGYSPPWPTPSADPDLPSGAFRTYLDNSMSHLLAAGHQVTNDYAQMDLFEGSGANGDFDRDGFVDADDHALFAACFTGPGGGPVGPECEAADFDGDGDVDCDDWACFQAVWTGPGDVTPLPECESTGVEVDGGTGGGDVGDGGDGDGEDGDGDRGRGAGGVDHGAPDSQRPTLRAFPNPAEGGTRIEYSVVSGERVRLGIFDVRGRRLRTLSAVATGPGPHAIEWDGRDDSGAAVPRGVYRCRLDAGGGVISTPIVIR